MHIHDVGRWSAVYFVADGSGEGGGEGGEDGGSGEEEGGEGGSGEGGSGDADAARGVGGGSMARHLVFRGGAQGSCPVPSQPRCEGDTALEEVKLAGEVNGEGEEAPPSSHCYLAVPPLPGTLWLFPGSIPHCVLGAKDVVDALDRSEELDADAEKPDEEARISIAINMTEATAPPPHARNALAEM